jgi:hypothetical protein
MEPTEDRTIRGIRTARGGIVQVHRSCVACQRLRVKCSNERPCAQCVSQNVVCWDKVRLELLFRDDMPARPSI